MKLLNLLVSWAWASVLDRRRGSCCYRLDLLDWTRGLAAERLPSYPCHLGGCRRHRPDSTGPSRSPEGVAIAETDPTDWPDRRRLGRRPKNCYPDCQTCCWRCLGSDCFAVGSSAGNHHVGPDRHRDGSGYEVGIDFEALDRDFRHEVRRLRHEEASGRSRLSYRVRASGRHASRGRILFPEVLLASWARLACRP